MRKLEERASALTRHGGDVGLAARLYPDAPAPWLDLSTGINPVAWTQVEPPPIDLRALPSADGLAALEGAAAEAFGATALPVAALPGTEIGLRLLATLALPRPVRYLAPTYRTYGETLADAVPIPVSELERAAEAGGTIILANPNNPDGRIVAPERLLMLARRLRERDGLLVVDEAFADVDPAISILPSLAQDDAVLVFRSFGKFFGLAGVRLGFACGPAARVAPLRDRLGSWPVSAQAIALGTAAYRDHDWIAAARTSITAMAAALDTVLAEHALAATGGCPLFRLVETDATALFERLARGGILTRPFDYAPRWLRFGLPADASEVDRLARALRRG